MIAYIEGENSGSIVIEIIEFDDNFIIDIVQHTDPRIYILNSLGDMFEKFPEMMQHFGKINEALNKPAKNLVMQYWARKAGKVFAYYCK